MINISNIECLDPIFHFFMKSYLRKTNNGVDSLKIDIKNLDECVITFISYSIDLIKDGYSPLEMDFLLEYELLKIINEKKRENTLIFQITLAKKLFVSLQSEELDLFFELWNLYGQQSREYLCLTFIPNLSEDIQLKYQLMMNIPADQSKLRLDDY